MKAIDRPLTHVIHGNHQFVIPVFQRDYSWTTEQCCELWRSVLVASESQFFLGSIVYITSGTIGPGFGSWLVIDGQQRLTTLTLLLIALRDSINESNWQGKAESPTVERINAYYLKNVFENGGRQYKLALRRADDSTLKALVDAEKLDDLDEFGENRSEKILEAYYYFKDLMKSDECDFDKIYRGIGRLKIVDVTLERNVDNPHLVFESMNSTGVDLSQSDLVRNFLLMRIDESEQTALYQKYWAKIDKYFRDSRDGFDLFLRDFIALKTKSSQPIRFDQIYNKFKDFWHTKATSGSDSELSQMKETARTYASFLGTEPMQRPWLAAAMSSMRSLGTTQGVLVMQLYKCHINEDNNLDQNQFVNAIRLIESYILRRAVLGLRSTSYWTLFTRIAHELDPADVYSSLMVGFAGLPSSYSFPSNEEFKRALQENDLYHYRICRHVLNGIENFEQKEISPTNDYSIEHIMPQSIQGVEDWQKMLGKDWEQIHKTWLHRLGNLTLTAYNSKYSNLPFETKKNISGGFNESAVRLNQFIRQQDCWTQKEMEERGRVLAQRALEIWPALNDSEETRKVKLNKLLDQSKIKTVADLKMSDRVRVIVDTTLREIRNVSELIEIVEHKTLNLYTFSAECFVELIPHESSLRLALPLTYSEIDKPAELSLHDASHWVFVKFRNHREHNLLVDIWHEQQVQKVLPLVRQALEQSN